MRLISVARARWLMILGPLTYFLSLYWDGALPRLFCLRQSQSRLLASLPLRLCWPARNQEGNGSAFAPMPPPAPAPASVAAAKTAPRPESAHAGGGAHAFAGASFPITRSVPWNARLLLAMLLLGIAMLLHWWVLGQMLLRPEALPLSMQESAALQRLWAGVVSLFISLSILFLCIVFSALLVVNLDFWNLSEPPGYDPDARQRHWLAAVRRAFYIVLGLSLGTVILDRGKLYRPDGEEVDIKGCAGPIYLDVREGQVAIIETKGLTDEAVNGRRWLDANQRVTGTADLTVQKASVAVERVLTKDGLTIGLFEFTVRYSIGKGTTSGDGWPASGQFTYNPEQTRVKMWKDTPESYKAGIVAVAQVVSRSVIGSFDLKDVIIMPGAARTGVEEQIRCGIQRMMGDEGVLWLDVKSVAIGEVIVPDEASKELTDHWVALMQAGTDEIRSQTQKKALVVKSEGHVEAFANLEKAKDRVRAGLIDQIRSLAASDPQLADRYLAALENITGHLVQDNVQGWHTVETLESMARSSDSFSF